MPGPPAAGKPPFPERWASGFFWAERTPQSTVADTVARVEAHFGLGKSLPELKKVDADTELARKLIRFVEDCSRAEVKAHLLQMLHRWEFSDWETPFVAMLDGQIVGMAFLMKTDYYPLPEIYPWVTGIFVTEAYRGHRISERLVNFANAYAMQCGFDRTYIPTDHVGLYEKYGYRYLREIVNYGGGTDRLYGKQLER